MAAKVASIGMPFVLKHIVDDLDGQLANPTIIVLSVPFALLIAYGFIRLANSVLGEIPDTFFGRITERAMRRIGLRVFEHLHQLDLSFHGYRRYKHPFPFRKAFSKFTPWRRLGAYRPPKSSQRPKNRPSCYRI